jgi:phosphatidylserine/phosphatidylglycerophosphate/cardiolipin synthase-like enzyme
MASELSKGSDHGVHVVAYRGEGNCLLAFDLDDALLTPDLVGFSVEVRYPSGKWFPLTNRLNFTSKPDATGKRKFSSLDAPFQKFRWSHYPSTVGNGQFHYRVTPAYMDSQGHVSQRPGVEVDADLSAVSVEQALNIAFTRGFVASQAYVARFKNNRKILPKPLPKGTVGCAELPFDVSKCQPEFDWLGFEARRTLFQFLDDCVEDSKVEVLLMAYELKEPDVVAKLEALGARLRAIIDDHAEQGDPKSCESGAAKRLQKSAGAGNVKRMHFGSQQHNKVLVALRNGTPERVLTGSTNFSLRGLYIQANNLLDFPGSKVAGLYRDVFDAYWNDADNFRQHQLSSGWQMVKVQGETFEFCIAPHSESDTSLSRVSGAITNADSSVLFAIAFLYQSGGAVREAIDALDGRDVFSYGLSDSEGSLKLKKPDGTFGIVPFAYLDKHVPSPFQNEWSGGSGRHIHHKFVVCDFNDENPVVFTGSSNLSPAGEKGNGDNLIMIQNRRVATAYAIEAVRLFDHYQFRAAMKEAEDSGTKPDEIVLKKAVKKLEDAWFAQSLDKNDAKYRDRMLFTKPLRK